MRSIKRKIIKAWDRLTIGWLLMMGACWAPPENPYASSPEFNMPTGWAKACAQEEALLKVVIMSDCSWQDPGCPEQDTLPEPSIAIKKQVTHALKSLKSKPHDMEKFLRHLAMVNNAQQVTQQRSDLSSN